MVPIIAPLTKDTLKDRISQSFPSTYLTTISIIQGVALGILASKTFEPIDFQNLVAVLPYSIASLVIIIAVLYEYTWFVGIFQWPPKIFDAVVPMVLGFSEVAPMFCVKNPQEWWMLSAIFCLVAAGAFLNSLCNCKLSVFGENSEACSRTKREFKGNIVISLIAALICLLVWYLGLYLGGLSLIPFMLCAAVMLWKGERFKKSLYKDFGLI